MKNISAQKLGLFALLLFFYCVNLSAQKQDEVVIINKIVSEDRTIAKSPRPILGIYTDELAEVQGIKIKRIIAGKGAEQAGLQDGDVITVINGQTVALTGDLHAVLANRAPGDKVNVQYLRDGKDNLTVIELSAATDNFEWKEEKYQRDPCKVFIGVGTSSVSGGLKVDYTVDNTPATESGIQAGDVLLALDGVPLSTQTELVYERNKHQPGDAFTMTILRDGREMKIDARFKECSEEEKTEARLMVYRSHARTFSHTVERDPCAVFIGVYTSDRALDGQGVRISGVIDNTPAQESSLQPGDVILALDGRPVNTQRELLAERNKHQPGDLFRLTVVRDGARLDIDAIFKSCQKESDNKVAVKETVQMNSEETPAPDREDATLRLESLELYPNPTFGPVNVQFEGDAVPTVVRITDMSGRAVYTNELPQFGGFFSEQINLFGKTPGNYVLTVQQGDKILTKPVVLMPRA